MWPNYQTRRWQVAVTAGLLSLAIMGIVFAIWGITPFGNHNLLISDMGGQYLSFFTAYRHAILTHSFQLYSFSQSLGGNALPTIAYYLLSPFNILMLLFPAANLPTGLSLLIMLKISLIAVTMTAFYKRIFKQSGGRLPFWCCFQPLWLRCPQLFYDHVVGCINLVTTGHSRTRPLNCN